MAPWALGADVAIPHTFLPGARASAAQVNANFSAVEAGIDDNARAIADLQAQIQALQAVAIGGLVVKIAGTKVGYFVTGGPDDSAFGSYNELLAITDEGYFFGVSLGEAESGDPIVSPEGALSPRDTYFTQPNCVGTRYLAFEYGDWTFMWKQGFVVGATRPSDAVKAYRVKGAPVSLSMFSVQSRTSTAEVSCTNLPAAKVMKSLPLVANDPSVTGLQNEYAGTIQVLPR